ncbi:hypothetical protein [Methylophaga lonarensis]|uniref:hypothetical protein n=1 Tax=Methylophaga lonarensis TaxID=999151 RepID=UPI000349362A|nr:hypothetical protein [Methylophaga lonarensis]
MTGFTVLSDGVVVTFFVFLGSHPIIIHREIGALLEHFVDLPQNQAIVEKTSA